MPCTACSLAAFHEVDYSVPAAANGCTKMNMFIHIKQHKKERKE